jgi:hypothetical protein
MNSGAAYINTQAVYIENFQELQEFALDNNCDLNAVDNIKACDLAAIAEQIHNGEPSRRWYIVIYSFSSTGKLGLHGFCLQVSTELYF